MSQYEGRQARGVLLFSLKGRLFSMSQAFWWFDGTHSQQRERSALYSLQHNGYLIQKCPPDVQNDGGYVWVPKDPVKFTRPMNCDRHSCFLRCSAPLLLSPNLERLNPRPSQRSTFSLLLFPSLALLLSLLLDKLLSERTSHRDWDVAQVVEFLPNVHKAWV